MAKLVTYIFIVSSLVLWYLLLFGSTLSGVEATNGHGSQLEGRDFHHHGGSHHIRRKYWPSEAARGSENTLCRSWWLLSASCNWAVPFSITLTTCLSPSLSLLFFAGNINHCWRRYDGYNLQNTIVNKKEQLKKPYGILCNFKCTWFFTIRWVNLPPPSITANLSNITNPASLPLSLSLLFCLSAFPLANTSTTTSYPVCCSLHCPTAPASSARCLTSSARFDRSITFD